MKITGVLITIFIATAMQHAEAGRCKYECPSYSHKRHGVWCPTSFRDCDCDYGYKRWRHGCYKPKPTYSPTQYPTDAPTYSPTQYPTDAPTYSPTQYPTDAPTYSPTQYPTDAPTYSPTQYPTDAPTYSPTQYPTDAPTYSPTQYPTDAPTEKEFKCPKNSFPLKRYPTSWYDCKCKRGFVAEGHKCVPLCTYKCPANSTPTTHCPKTFHDCKCDAYHVKAFDACHRYW